MDASKYAWECVLMQAYDHIIDGKEMIILHPITYMSGLFRDSQLNWATLTKEAYTTYMSVKKLSFFSDNADITLRSDHLPPKRFFKTNTLNSKANNCVVEIEEYQIKLDYIRGIKNTLVDTMSRLINTCQDLKPEGQEYGYCIFEELPYISMIRKVSPKANITLNDIMASSADSGIY